MKTPKHLFKNTVNVELWNALTKLMKLDEFSKFRLVGGTALSLIFGHRKSVDIDLFTDEQYGSIDFHKIDQILKENFQFVEDRDINIVSFGKTYFIGNQPDIFIKLDVFYTDDFVFPLHNIDGIRVADIREIVAMKLEAICNAKRKKDFWDLHELAEHVSISEMLKFHEKRYPYTHQKDEILQSLSMMDLADDDFEPICLKNKYWELIKIDLQKIVP